jgi:hypothetical protein
MRRRTLRGIGWALGALAAAGPCLADELAEPVRIEAEGKPIDTESGHAAPFVGDFDGDGLADLLVGQMGDGLLRVYLNRGSKAAPALGTGAKFQEGRPEGTVPTG